MKLLASFFLTIAVGLNTARAQHGIDSSFVGFEEKCTVLPDGSKHCYDAESPGNWYDKTTLGFCGDSVFVSQSPVHVIGRDTMHPASDGGFYYWKGILRREDNSITIHLTMCSCDYCPMTMQRGPEGRLVPVIEQKVYSGHSGGTAGLWLNGTLFRRDD